MLTTEQTHASSRRRSWLFGDEARNQAGAVILVEAVRHTERRHVDAEGSGKIENRRHGSLYAPTFIHREQAYRFCGYCTRNKLSKNKKRTRNKLIFKHMTGVRTLDLVLTNRCLCH